MKQTIELSQDDIKQAIANYLYHKGRGERFVTTFVAKNQRVGSNLFYDVYKICES